MQEVLGYKKFAAEGGDWGAFVAEQLGHKYPRHLIGIYLTLAAPMDFFARRTVTRDEYGEDKQAALLRSREVAPVVTTMLRFRRLTHRPWRMPCMIRPPGCAHGYWSGGGTGATAAAMSNGDSLRMSC